MFARHQTDGCMMPSVSQAPKTRLFSVRTLTMPSPQYACTCLNNCLFCKTLLTHWMYVAYGIHY